MRLRRTREQFSVLGPSYFSVTYGAGGSTREPTRATVLEIKSAGCDVAPHLSFGGDDEAHVEALLQTYVEAGIRRVVALRGDLPSGMGLQRMRHASELVAFIRARFADHFKIAVACYPEVHPEASSYLEDVDYLKRKLDAGADYAVTQYFYNPDSYCRFMDECARAGIDKPIVPGIMPITNLDNLLRFSKACGAEVPRWLRKSLEPLRGEELLQYGEEAVTGLCCRLAEQGVDRFHFYTLNQFAPTAAICRNLGLVD